MVPAQVTLALLNIAASILKLVMRFSGRDSKDMAPTTSVSSLRLSMP